MGLSADRRLLFVFYGIMMNGLFITGTDTEIGKTFITAILTLGLRNMGMSVCPAKPIASGGVLYENSWISEDVLTYQRLTGILEAPSLLSPICFQRPASPHLAAELEGQSIRPQQAIDALHELAQWYEMLLIEGIGGWLVPITYEYSVADLAQEIQFPVLVVSANKLGTLNHTLLTLESIRNRGLSIAGVVMTNPNRPGDSDIAANNIETIKKVGHVEILGVIPYLGENAVQTHTPDTLWPKIKDQILWQRIRQILHTPGNV